jgi:hypothetical protein
MHLDKLLKVWYLVARCAAFGSASPGCTERAAGARVPDKKYLRRRNEKHGGQQSRAGNSPVV